MLNHVKRHTWYTKDILYYWSKIHTHTHTETHISWEIFLTLPLPVVTILHKLEVSFELEYHFLYWPLLDTTPILFDCCKYETHTELCFIVFILRLCLKLMNICIRYGRIKWRRSLCSLAFLVGLWIFHLIQKLRSGWLQKKDISKRYRWKTFFPL